MKWCLGLLAVCLVVSACGSSARVVSTAPHGSDRLVPPSPTAFRFSTASNRAFARQDVRKLLHILVLPSSARVLTKAPAGAPHWLRSQFAHRGTSNGTAQARGIWLVPEPRGQVRSFIQAHARRTPPLESVYAHKGEEIGARTSGYYTFAPAAGRSWSRSLYVTMTPLRGSSTIVVAQAQETWNHRSPKSDVLPSGVERIEITSRYWGGRKSVDVHVRNRFDVASIVSWMNGLSSGPMYICAWGAFGGGPTVTLTFHSATGDVLARAQVYDTLGDGVSGPCNPIRLTIGSRHPAGLIGGDLLLRIQRLLDIDLSPVQPSVFSSCLRRKGWVTHTLHGSPVRVVALHHGRRWTITFRLSGKVTTSPPPHGAVAHCLIVPQFFAFK